MSARVEVNGSEIVIRIQTEAAPSQVATGDRLIRLDAATCKAEGFELSGLKAKVRAGDLAVVKIGRATYVRMSDLCALATTTGKVAAKAEGDAAYAQAVMAARRRRRHAA